VIHADEACHLDAGTDLFLALAGRCIPRIFVVVHESARKAPEAATWLDRAPS
jgi:hypothetical protein